MRFGSFDITEEGNNYYLERDKYPRMSLRLVFNDGIAEIKDIKLLDDCSATQVLQILQQIEDFLENH